MATIKSYSDLQQSKKLAEILPLESADMHWQDASKEYENPYGIYDRYFRLVAGNSSKIINNKRDFRKGFVLPAWSLSALLGVLPEGYSFVLTKSFNGKDYYCKLDGKPIETMAYNPVDACYEMIIRLNELKML